MFYDNSSMPSLPITKIISTIYIYYFMLCNVFVSVSFAWLIFETFPWQWLLRVYNFSAMFRQPINRARQTCTFPLDNYIIPYTSRYLDLHLQYTIQVHAYVSLYQFVDDLNKLWQLQSRHDNILTAYTLLFSLGLFFACFYNSFRLVIFTVTRNRF